MNNIHIDAEQCINCFDCSERFPEIFKENIELGIHFIIRQPTNEDEMIECEDAAYRCPTGAIIVS